MLIDESNRDTGNPWGISFLAMFHMANDSGLFVDGPGEDQLPLYEAKMIHQLDHRYGTYAGQTEAQAAQGILPRPSVGEKTDRTYAVRPRYWVHSSDVDAALGDRPELGWYLGWRNITSAVSERTFIASVLPRVAVNHSMPLMFSPVGEFPFMVANLTSFALDWVTRQKLGGLNLTFFVVRQLPVLSRSAYRASPSWTERPLGDWLRPYVAELTYTSDDVSGLADELGWQGPPFVWSDERRPHLRAEVDAAYMHLYGIARPDVERILDSFWVVRDRDERGYGSFRTKDLVLNAYDAMAVATAQSPFVSQLDPPPGDRQAAYPPRPGKERGHWIPWSEAISRAQQADPVTIVAHSGAASPPGPKRVSRSPAIAEPAPSLFEPNPASAWQPETVVSPTAIVMGSRVRHRAKGEGTILSVRPSGKHTELLIRFDTRDEAWIVFGYGVLEFAGYADG